MTSMLVSLILKARAEGAEAVKNLRAELAAVKAEEATLDRGGAYRLGFAIGRTIRGAQELKGALAAVGKEAAGIARSLVYGGLGAGGALFGFNELFLKPAKEIGALRNRLIGLEGSDTRGDMALDWIKNFREHTNETLEQVTEAWIALRERGVNPVTGALQTIADTAAVTGASMEDVARAIGNAVEGGRAGPLRELGISVQAVGHQMVVTYRKAGMEIREVLNNIRPHEAEKGILRILAQLHPGSAERAAQGLGGQLKRLGELWNEFAMDVMGSGPGQGGVMKFLAQQLGGLVKEAKEAGEGGKSLAHDLASAFKEAFRLGFALLRLTAEVLPPLVEGLRELSHALGGPKVLAAALALAMGSGLIRALWGLGAVLVTTVIPAIYALGVALMTTPVGWIIMAIAALVVAAYELYEHWDEVTGWLGEVWERMQADFTDTWNGIKAAAADNAAEFMKVWQPVQGFFEALWAALKEGFEALQPVFDRIFGALKTAYDYSLGPIIEGLKTLKSLGGNTFGGNTFGGATIGGAQFGASAQKVEGRAKLDITIDSEGRPSGKFRDEGGSLGFDANLGFGMIP